MNKRNLSISNSKKIYVFGAKILFACLLLVAYINHILPQYEQGYNASLIDKVNRLESINEPKIVLLGHSNLTFGIDSKIIEEQLGMPVVNMGLHGGIGNAFHEEMAKFNVCPGDIYVLCHSEFADDNMIGDTMTAWSSIENHLKLWKILRLNDVETMVRSFPIYLKKSLPLYSAGTGNWDPGGVYARSAFNEYGDIALERIGSYYNFETGVGPSVIGEDCINRINELNSYLTEKGATLVVAGYPIGNGKLTVRAEEFVEFQKSLTEKLDCPVISNYVDYLFDYKYFFNTNLHLTTEGAILRTNQLVDDLKRWQKSDKDASMENDQYIDIISDGNLSKIEDFDIYISELAKNKDRYTIFVSVKDDASASLNNQMGTALASLGLKESLSDKFQWGYVAVIECGTVIIEDCQNEKIDVSGTFDNEKMRYAITSAGYNRGSISSILINEQEYSENVSGMNFVVYSNETHRILDEVCFDTGSAELTVTR